MILMKKHYENSQQRIIQVSCPKSHTAGLISSVSILREEGRSFDDGVCSS